jgi:putative FmdB family regulatory protein
MPIYEYKCQSCGHELEKLQRISDPSLTDCPFCDEPALQRLMSAAGFRLKGAGWYETDFKTGSKKNLHEPLESKTEGSKPGESKTEGSKPGESKTEGSKPGESKTEGSKPAEAAKTPPKTSESSKATGASAANKTDAA